jgi:hypothetical protein
MTPLKTYTVKENTHFSSTRNHRLVRAACAKGLTNVSISRYPNSQPGGGWYLYSDQITKLHIGYEVSEAESRINQIEVKN